MAHLNVLLNTLDAIIQVDQKTNHQEIIQDYYFSLRLVSQFIENEKVNLRQVKILLDMYSVAEIIYHNSLYGKETFRKSEEWKILVELAIRVRGTLKRAT